jgi:hypothetical protein
LRFETDFLGPCSEISPARTFSRHPHTLLVLALADAYVADVSSGIDMALTLVAEEFGANAAQLTQLLIEYDPQPPFDAGSPEKAPAQIVTAAREGFTKLQATSQ